MYLFRESEAMLNRLAVRPEQQQAVFTVHYWGAQEKLPSNPVHKHTFFEACYVLGGEGIYMDEMTEYPLRPGVMFVSRPGAVHQIRTSDGLRILFVAFEPEETGTAEAIMEAFRRLADGKVLVEDASRTAAARLWEALLIRADEPGQLPPAAVASAAGALLMSLPAVFGESPAHASSRPRFNHDLLRQAKLYIRDNLSSRLSLADTARYLNVSERHLSRLFAGGIDESFTDYVRRERVRFAARLLAETDLPIKSIAEMAGFSSVHYFTRTFTRTKAMAPGRFRAKTRC